jgi:hypothetical protein
MYPSFVSSCTFRVLFLWPVPQPTEGVYDGSGLLGILLKSHIHAASRSLCAASGLGAFARGAYVGVFQVRNGRCNR